MKPLFALIALALLSGCSTTARIGAYHDFEGDVAGDNPAAYFEVRKGFNGFDCSAIHISHWTSGIPFNNRYEEELNLAGCSWIAW